MKHAADIVHSGIVRTCMILVIICLLPDLVQARPELGPPSIKLRTNLSNVVVAELDSISDDHKLGFEIIENLHNEAEQSIIIRSDALTAAQLSIGQRYVLAFVDRDVQRFPRVVKPRRDGAVIISLPGATPAVFQPNVNLIELLTWDLDESLKSPETMLPLILQGMAERDPQLQNFFATELVTRPRLYSMLTRKQRKTVAGYISNPAYSPMARNLMLGDPAFSGLLLRRSDTLKIAREILVQHPVHVNFGSPYGALIRTAMKIVESKPNSRDALEARRWLHSNQPALIESAASIIYAADPDVLIDALDQAGQYTLLETQSRDALTNLLRRYRRVVAEN